MKPELLIVSGPNGGGKTTFSKKFLSEHAEYEYLNPDEIAVELDAVGHVNSRISVGREYFKRIDLVLEQKKSTLLESTISGLTLKSKIEKFKSCGYETTLAFIYLDNANLCIERIKERVSKGGHDVPRVDVVRRFKRSKINFWRFYRLVVDKWVLVYNGETDFMEIANGEKDTYTIKNKTRFRKFVSQTRIK